LGFIAAGVGLFLSVVSANVIIDPQGVFGTGAFPVSSNANARYLKFMAYSEAPDRYDGLFFGSSRAVAIPIDDLSAHMGGIEFADFAVALGSVADHLAVLRHVLAEKASKGRKLRAVFLLLDADSFGTRPFMNTTRQYAQPPAISGESAGRFWWKNLTAIQYEAWSSVFQEMRKNQPREVQTLQLRTFGVDLMQSLMALTGPGAAHAQAPAARSRDGMGERLTETFYFLPNLQDLDRFASLCRSQGIELLVAISPVHRSSVAHYDPDDLANVTDRISRIVPAWDFTNAPWLSERPELWRDINHFRPEVGRMMIRRMFGEQVLGPWKDFGLRRAPGSGS
jgi:hypothetical protein